MNRIQRVLKALKSQTDEEKLTTIDGCDEILERYGYRGYASFTQSHDKNKYKKWWANNRFKISEGSENHFSDGKQYDTKLKAIQALTKSAIVDELMKS